MRPSNALERDNPRPRKPSHDTNTVPSTAPTTFFLARESEVRQAINSRSTASHDSHPVSTLKETIDEATQPHRIVRRTSTKDGRSNSRRRSTIKPRSIEGLNQQALFQQPLPTRPVSSTNTTPPTISQEPSLPASPKSSSSRSLYKSDDELTQDETNSQAIESEDENDRDEDMTTSMQNSAPQLIMPSIRMPSRRPFTARGKALGRFKIMVAGAEGCGKSSLIKSIVQICEDIVHVDSSAMNTSGSQFPSRNPARDTCPETYASTKAYPKWWSDVDESRLLKRRKSIGDSVLERNLCFVKATTSRKGGNASKYIEQQLINTISCANQANSELTGLLSGNGGSQVDVVLYLVSHATLKDDCDQIQSLSKIANVIPLVSKSDLLTAEQIRDVKTAIDDSWCALSKASTLRATDAHEGGSYGSYAVSSLNGPDFDNMDASLLMSSDYVQPLMPSELNELIDKIFHSDTVAYLRHTAARKLVIWYNSDTKHHSIAAASSSHSPAPSTLNSPLQASLSASASGAHLLPLASEISLNTSNSFALARVADHAQKEERIAQVRLSRWASDLQLSLQREREKYEGIARSQRAVWLLEKMGEEIREGQIVPYANSQPVTSTTKSRRILPTNASDVSYQIHDPLGLLRWEETMRARGWIALQIVGSFGVVGGLALWLVKTWDLGTSLTQWIQEWSPELSGLGLQREARC